MPQPARLGKYEIQEPLGKGAMGVVYKGFDPNIRRTVALKTIRKELSADDPSNQVARFKNEAQAAGRLSHPGIVAVFDYGEDGDIAYIAMEYVQGRDLGSYFKGGIRFGVEDAVSIMVQLLDALEHAHSQGVIHRDIKPANIIIMDNGRLKVADFGIARIDLSELTQSGMIMGTPSYMAPEQYIGGNIDGRADLYAAGVVLFELLTGEKPFRGRNEQVIYKIHHEPAPLPSSIDPSGVSLRFDSVVQKALAKDPADRFQTARIFRDALLQAHAAPAAEAVSEETLCRAGAQVPSRNDPHLSSPKEEALSHGGRAAPNGWDHEVLKEIEQELASFIGPLAGVMVRKAAAATTDPDALYKELAGNLATTEERSAFLGGKIKRVGTSGIRVSQATALPPTSMASSTDPGNGLSPDIINKAARELASFLGPISKLVAKRAASRCTNEEQFYLLLAENLSDLGERKRFLQAAGFTA
jgi:serine/threonine protein kinase